MASPPRSRHGSPRALSTTLTRRFTGWGPWMFRCRSRRCLKISRSRPPRWWSPLPAGSAGSDPGAAMSKLTKTYGLNAVDWEQRTAFDRRRKERLARAKSALDASEMGALLLFDMYNIRYVTATHIGTWATDKAARFALLPREDEPIMWDFGSAARHHKLYNPWLGEERSRAGISTMRGSFSPAMGRAEDVAGKIRVELEERGLLGAPLGVDLVEPPVLFALQREGI